MELENLLQQFRKPYGSRTYIGLNRIKAILEVLGNPQNRFLAVHIAGTNGKGSVSAMFHSVFSEFNLKVGLFTSPHLERFTERIKINNTEIDEKEFIDILTNIVIPAIEKIDTVKLDTPTEFEIITVTAFYYFYKQNIDIAVIEAGLGGRLDSTNILENLIFSVITSISRDHTDRLGKTVREITSEKVGIIKPDTNIISTELNSDKDLFYESVKNLNNSDVSFLHFADSSLLYSDKISLKSIANQSFRVYQYLDKYSIFYNKKIESNLIADYQKENIALVLKSLEVLYKSIYNSAKKEINYQITVDKDYNKIQERLMVECPALKMLLGSDNTKLKYSYSKNKKALEYYSEGQKYLGQEKFDMALVELNKAVTKDPKFAFAWDNMGVCYRKMGRFNEAIECYKKSLALDPNGSMPLMNMAVAYTYLKDYKNATETYNKYSSFYPKDPEGFYGIARIERLTKNYSDALENALKAFQLYEEIASPYKADAIGVIREIVQDLKDENKLEIFNTFAEKYGLEKIKN